VRICVRECAVHADGVPALAWLVQRLEDGIEDPADQAVDAGVGKQVGRKGTGP